LGFEEHTLKVLLIHSDLKEYNDLYSLPGDLVKPTEDLDTAPYRVLKERTGLGNVYLEQVYTFGNVRRHPAGRVITTAYYSLLNIKDLDLHLSNKYGTPPQWVPVYEIKKLAFDHKKILDTCIERLREKIMESPVVFNLLPEKFSLRELQILYEEILGVKLDRRNFRKKLFLMHWLEDLEEYEQDVSHRPGKLYRYRAQEK
jgi:8-oxo-dGTP diphosphatase